MQGGRQRHTLAGATEAGQAAEIAEAVEAVQARAGQAGRKTIESYSGIKKTPYREETPSLNKFEVL